MLNYCSKKLETAKGEVKADMDGAGSQYSTDRYHIGQIKTQVLILIYTDPIYMAK